MDHKVLIKKFVCLIVFVLTSFTTNHIVQAYAYDYKWGGTSATYKFDNNIRTDFKSPSNRSANTWTNISYCSWSWSMNSNSQNVVFQNVISGPTLAVTTKYISNNKLQRISIAIDYTENWYTGTGSPSSNQYDLESAMAHEWGHGIGLIHTQSTYCSGTGSATMCPTIPAGTTYLRSLADDDKNGCDVLYP
jgi:hypothetical protein